MFDVQLLASGGGDTSYLNPILLFGIMILGGTFFSRLFQKFHIPQVVGCIIIGIVLRQVHFIDDTMIHKLHPFTMFALGIIGFMIGGELRAGVFKKYGKQFFMILFSQGFGAFLLVFIGTSAFGMFLFDEIGISLAMGLLFGAIASATAPAATVNVLWEFKTRGPLTAAILAIVALDDALALLLYRGAATGAQALVGTGKGSVLAATGLLFGELLGAIVLGSLAGLLLFFLLKFVRADDKVLGFSVASLLIVVGVSLIPEVDPILPAMTFGIVIANLSPRQSKNTFSLIERFSPPLYTAFFVLAGAHMQFGLLSWQMLVMIAVYLVLRALGKVIGSWYGAKKTKAPKSVQNYLGICLLPQAGVAIGLAILASQQFSDLNPEYSQMIIMVVMTGTFVMEVLGPMMVKIGVKRAGEVGLNITEEDLIKSYDIKDVMDAEPVTIKQDVPLQEILDVFSKTDYVYYPVIDNDSKIVGMITVAGIKEMFANQDVAGWLLAMDVAGPVKDKVLPTQRLGDVLEHMNQYHLESVAVVQDEGDKLIGMLNARRVMRKISAEVLHRRQQADGLHLPAF